MDQFLIFDTGRTNTAGIQPSLLPLPNPSPLGEGQGVGSPCTINKLGISNSQSQFLIPFRTEKELGMAHPLVQNGLDQFLLNLIVSFYISEFHVLRYG